MNPETDPESGRPSFNWIDGACWIVIAIWFIGWMYMAQKRSWADALDIGNPSIMGIAAFLSFLIFSVRRWGVRGVAILGGSVFALVAIAVGGMYAYTKPLELARGDTFSLTFEGDVPRGTKAIELRPRAQGGKWIVRVYRDEVLLAENQQYFAQSNKVYEFGIFSGFYFDVSGLVGKGVSGRIEITAVDPLIIAKLTDKTKPGWFKVCRTSRICSAHSLRILDWQIVESSSVNAIELRLETEQAKVGDLVQAWDGSGVCGTAESETGPTFKVRDGDGYSRYVKKSDAIPTKSCTTD